MMHDLSTRLSPGRVAGSLAAAAVACGTLLACEDTGRLRLEDMGRPAFDPVRYDPGPMPAPRGPLPKKLVFGITPFYSAERQAPALARLQVYLEATLGLKIETRVSETYEEVVSLLADGSLDVAQLSPFAYIRATERISDLLGLATAVAQGTTSYASYIIVKTDAPWSSVEAAKGSRLGFTDRWSTSGYVVPAAWMLARGLKPERDFRVSWLGSHDKALQAVLDGSIDLAAVSSDTVVSSRVIGLGGPIRVLAKPGRIPYDAIVVRNVMDPALVWKVRRAFLTLSVHNKAGRTVLQDFNLINGFMPIPPGHYDSVRKVARRFARASP